MQGSGSSYHATDGAAYEWFLGRWSRRLAGPLLDFAGFPGDGALLDVGCATGSVANTMAGRWPGRRIVAVDIAAPYVAFARSRPASDRVAFAVADAVRLPHGDASFDGAAAQLVLNFVSDPVAALREMQRVTVPGGRVVAAIWDFRGGLVFQRMFWDTAAGIDPAAAAARDKLFSSQLALPEGLPRLFQAVGLDRIEQTSITIRMDYANFDDYWQPLCGGQGPVGTYLEKLAPDVRGRIAQAVAGAYRSGAPDGPRSLTATAWVARGQVSKGI
jgi:SAM-dependent methyltransferase